MFIESIRNKMLYNSYNTKDIYDLIALMNGPVKEALNIPEYVEWGKHAGDIFPYLYDDFMLPVTDIGKSKKQKIYPCIFRKI